jgi:TadE-like protein
MDRRIRRSTQPPQAQRGMGLVEFAWLLPVMVLLAMGAISLSTALYNKLIMNQASRQAVRSWVVSKPVMSKDSVQALASSLCNDQIISFGSSAVVCVPVATGPDLPVPGDVLTVSVSLNFTGLYLFSNLQISTQTSMKYE